MKAVEARKEHFQWAERDIECSCHSFRHKVRSEKLLKACNNDVLPFAFNSTQRPCPTIRMVLQASFSEITLIVGAHGQGTVAK
jgi:hypothetical protein